MTTEPLPKWELKKFAILWKNFGTSEFTNAEADKLLKEKDKHLLSVLFYDLKNHGWIEVNRDGKDKRKKIYKLREPNNIFNEF